MAIATKDGRVFNIDSEPIEVSSNHRADTAWVFVDAAGHEHRWWTDGAPATNYNPSKSYSVPTLRFVVDERWIDEDGEERELGHYECVKCGEQVSRRFTADTWRQFIPGPRSYSIDGELVSEETFYREAKAAGLA